MLRRTKVLRNILTVLNKQVSRRFLCLLLKFSLTWDENILTVANHEESILSIWKDSWSVVKPASVVSYNSTFNTLVQISTLFQDERNGKHEFLLPSIGKDVANYDDRWYIVLTRWHTFLGLCSHSSLDETFIQLCIPISCLEWIFWVLYIIIYQSPFFFQPCHCQLGPFSNLAVWPFQPLHWQKEREKTSRGQDCLFRQQNSLCWLKSYTKLWPWMGDKTVLWTEGG